MAPVLKVHHGVVINRAPQGWVIDNVSMDGVKSGSSRAGMEGPVSTNGFPAYDTDSMVLRPLTELPMLRVTDPARDVRGWEVRGHDGQRLGTVADLLVDVDRLRADTLLVVLAGGDRAGATVVVPLNGVSPADDRHHRLVPGEGMPPIVLGYESTTRYAVWAGIAAVLIALAGWVLGFFG